MPDYCYFIHLGYGNSRQPKVFRRVILKETAMLRKLGSAPEGMSYYNSYPSSSLNQIERATSFTSVEALLAGYHQNLARKLAEARRIVAKVEAEMTEFIDVPEFPRG